MAVPVVFIALSVRGDPAVPDEVVPGAGSLTVPAPAGAVPRGTLVLLSGWTGRSLRERRTVGQRQGGRRYKKFSSASPVCVSMP